MEVRSQRRATASAAETPRTTRRKRCEFEEDSATGDSMRPQARKRRLRFVDAFHSISLRDNDDTAGTPSRPGFTGLNGIEDVFAEEDDDMSNVDVWTETSTLGDDDEDDLFLSDKEILQKQTERKV